MRTRLVLAVLTIAAVAGGGGRYLYLRSHDPLTRAQQALAEGRPRDALFALRDVTRDNPRDAAAFMLLGGVHAQLGDLVAAERDYKRARELGADRWTVLLRLGQIYLAERRFKDVLTEIPSTGASPTVNANNLALRARAYLGLDDVRTAELSLQSAVQLAPQNVEVLIAGARLAINKQDMAGAEAKVDAALKADPGNLEAALIKAQIAAARGDATEALAILDRAAIANPALPAPRLARANLLAIAGDLKRAEADVASVLAMQPRNAGAIYLAGVLAARGQRWAEAAARLQSLNDNGTRFPRASYFQAIVALGQNLPSSAVAFIDRYVAQNPNDPDGIRLQARAQLANRRPDLAVLALTGPVARGLDDPETLDLLGTSQAAVGNLPAAAATLQKALEKAPGNPSITTHLATVQVRQGDTADAVASLEQVRGDAGKQPGELETLTTALIAAGDTERAGTVLDRLRAAAGETEAVANLTGILALARFDTDQAITTFTAAIKRFPASTELRLNRAKALSAAGRRDEARQQLNEILAKDPTNIPALNTLVPFEVDAQRYTAAIRVLQAARTAAPRNEGMLAMLSDVLVRAGDPSGALAELNRARAAVTASPMLLAAQARAQLAAGKPEEAARSYRDALARQPDASTALALAALQTAQSDRAGAKATLDDAISRLPNTFDLLSRRVQLEAESDGLDAALALARSLREDKAQMPAATPLQGDLLMAAKRPKEAAAAFLDAMKADPGPALVLRAASAQIASGDDAGAAATLKTIEPDQSAALLQSQIDIRRGDWAAVARHTELALTGQPNDPALLNNLAFAYQMLGNPKARPVAQRAYLLDPSPDTADTLGWVLAQQDPAAAIPLLRQASSQRPADPAIRYHLAAALAKAGERAEARQLLQSAVAAKEAFEGKADAAALLATLASEATK